MDTTRITDPISDRLPSSGAIISSVTDVTSGLAEQIADHIGGIDVTDTVRRTRRTLSGVVPWLSPGESRRGGWMSNRWVLVGAAALVAVAIAVMLRRRSTQTSTDQPGRDDWSTSTPSTNGAMPTSTPTPSEREHADTSPAG